MTVPRLLRNERDGKGKYSVFDNRKNRYVLEDGPGQANEHFVMMLKDKYARAALPEFRDVWSVFEWADVKEAVRAR